MILKEVSTIFKNRGVSYKRRYNDKCKNYRKIKYYRIFYLSPEIRDRIEKFLKRQENVISFEFASRYGCFYVDLIIKVYYPEDVKEI